MKETYVRGPFTRFMGILFGLLAGNVLWIVFSLPLVTIGASTTALFHVMGKLVRDEDMNMVKSFWKSFKINFVQATGVWLILAAAYFLVYSSMRNVGNLGDLSSYALAVQIFVFIELIVVTVYIFPLLSRYDMQFFKYFKISFSLGNKHMLTTILCLACLALIAFFFYHFVSIFILVFVSLYAFCSYYLINRIFKKYNSQER